MPLFEVILSFDEPQKAFVETGSGWNESKNIYYYNLEGMILREKRRELRLKIIQAFIPVSMVLVINLVEKKVKKYMIRRFKGTLTQIQHLSMKDQNAFLFREFEEWIKTGGTSQVDDVCVIGVKR